MSKIVSMSSGAIDPINRTKRVFWRPDTDTTVLKVGQPVCYNSKAVHDHKERTIDPTHLGLTIDTYAEGKQEFTGRLFVVEEPQTDNLHAFAGIVKSLGSKAGADGDMIEIFTPVEGAVVPVYTDEDCVFDRTILGIHNAEADVSYPGVAIGIAKETKDRSGTDGVVWMQFKNFISDNQSAELIIDDEANASAVIVNKINIITNQTSGRFTALEVKATSGVAQAVSYDYGLALYVQADWDVLAGLNAVGSGHWINLNGGTTTGDSHISSLWAGVYEDGVTFTAVGYVTALTCSLQVADALTGDPGNLAYIMFRNDGAQAIDALFTCEENSDIGLAASAVTPDYSIPIKVRGTTYYLSVASTTT